LKYILQISIHPIKLDNENIFLEIKIQAAAQAIKRRHFLTLSNSMRKAKN